MLRQQVSGASFVDLVDEARARLREHMQRQQELQLKAMFEGRNSQPFTEALADLAEVMQRLIELRQTLAERNIERIVRASA